MTPERTNVYIDGFNLYYGCLKGQPYRWLNLRAFCELAFPPPRNAIGTIHYFTARVKARPDDPDQPNRQNTYLRALNTLPNLRIHFGHYLENVVRMRLAHPPAAGPRTVEVIKTEEKGSDVNIASHLLLDGFRNAYDVAVVISNDSDLAEPIRMVRHELRRKVIVLLPCCRAGSHQSVSLKKVSTLARKVEQVHLAASQFPLTVTEPDGTVLIKPASW
jgi:uncharacterized LabA/DUF88 family protein